MKETACANARGYKGAWHVGNTESLKVENGGWSKPGQTDSHHKLLSVGKKLI